MHILYFLIFSHSYWMFCFVFIIFFLFAPLYGKFLLTSLQAPWFFPWLDWVSLWITNSLVNTSSSRMVSAWQAFKYYPSQEACVFIRRHSSDGWHPYPIAQKMDVGDPSSTQPLSPAPSTAAEATYPKASCSLESLASREFLFVIIHKITQAKIFSLVSPWPRRNLWVPPWKTELDLERSLKILLYSFNLNSSLGSHFSLFLGILLAFFIIIPKGRRKKRIRISEFFILLLLF